MQSKTGEITEAESSVMEVLWSRPAGETVREIVIAVYGRHEHSLHGGVKSFLDRLMDKGFVRADKAGFSHRFFAVISREEFVGGQLRQMAEEHFGGALAPMLLTLVRQAKLTQKDRAAIEKLINTIRE